MRKSRITVLIFYLLIGVTFSLSAQVLGETVATVNLTRTQGITSQQVDEKLEEIRQMGSQSGVPIDQISRDQVIESLISEVLIKQAAERDGIRVQDEDLQRLVDQQKRQVESQLGQSLGDEEFQQRLEKQLGSVLRHRRPGPKREGGG